MKRFRPPKNLLRDFGYAGPSKYYDDGVRYKGLDLTPIEIDMAENYICDMDLINTHDLMWRWWEVKRVLEEARRRRIIGWGDDE